MNSNEDALPEDKNKKHNNDDSLIEDGAQNKTHREDDTVDIDFTESSAASEDAASSTQTSPQLDIGSIFPGKGDERRPPEWLGRGLLYTIIAVALAYFVWKSWGLVSYIVLDIVISLFIALAMEPFVLMLVKHGWKRSMAALICLVSLGAIVMVMMTMFGNMFIQQVVSMAKGVPSMYSSFTEWLQSQFNVKIPEINDLGTEIFNNAKDSSWLTGLAGQALSTTMGALHALIDLLTIVMVTYYVLASGPKMKRSLCQWMDEGMQRKFILIWTVVQDQVSGFLFSRTILAALNATFTGLFLMTIHVPYWMPLALFCGLVSQFIPTVGTYIGGALPVIFALSNGGLKTAVMVLVFIIVYQQVESFLFSPVVSQQTMNLNPAIAFLAVLTFGALFGALGAFLALPLAASIQTLFHIYIKRYEIIESPMLTDPTPTKVTFITKILRAVYSKITGRFGKSTGEDDDRVDGALSENATDTSNEDVSEE